MLGFVKLIFAEAYILAIVNVNVINHVTLENT